MNLRMRAFAVVWVLVLAVLSPSWADQVNPTGSYLGTSVSRVTGTKNLMSDYHAACDGVTDDSDAVVAAGASGLHIVVPDGTVCFAPRVTQSAMQGTFVGGGKIRTNVGNPAGPYGTRGPQFGSVLAPPNPGVWNQAASAEDNCAAGFVCWGNWDYSHVFSAEEFHISGVGTLGQPAHNYESMPGTQAHNLFIDNASGWNQSHNSNDGRTGSGAYSTLLQQNGGGDFGVFGAHIQCAGKVGPGDGNTAAGPGGIILVPPNGPTGYTDWLAVPECGFIGATEDALAPGQYLQIGEYAIADNGNDVTAIGQVRGYSRTATTALINNRWNDALITCNLGGGTIPCDAVNAIGGQWVIGDDYIGAGVVAPIAMSAGQKITLNGSPGASSFPEGAPQGKSNLGGDYLTDDGYSVLLGHNGTTALRLANPASAVNWWVMGGSTAGNAVTLSPQGSDTTVPLLLADKGGAGIIVQSGASQIARFGPSGLTVFPGTVAGLGACTAALEGTRAGVRDATAPTFLGALVGGGAVHSPAYCNGTTWVAG